MVRSFVCFSFMVYNIPSFWNAIYLGYYSSYSWRLQADTLLSTKTKCWEQKPLLDSIRINSEQLNWSCPNSVAFISKVFCFQLLCNLYHHDRLWMLSLSNSSSNKGFKRTGSHRFGCSTLRYYCPHLSTLHHSSAKGCHKAVQALCEHQTMLELAVFR